MPDTPPRFLPMTEDGWWLAEFPVPFLLQFCHRGTGRLDTTRTMVNFEWIATTDDSCYGYTHHVTGTQVDGVSPRVILHYWRHAAHREECSILARYAEVLLDVYYPKNDDGITYDNNARQVFDAVSRLRRR